MEERSCTDLGLPKGSGGSCDWVVPLQPVRKTLSGHCKNSAQYTCAPNLNVYPLKQRNPYYIFRRKPKLNGEQPSEMPLNFNHAFAGQEVWAQGVLLASRLPQLKACWFRRKKLHLDQCPSYDASCLQSYLFQRNIPEKAGQLGLKQLIAPSLPL